MALLKIYKPNDIAATYKLKLTELKGINSQLQISKLFSQQLLNRQKISRDFRELNITINKQDKIEHSTQHIAEHTLCFF